MWASASAVAGGLLWWLRADQALATAPATLADALTCGATLAASACTGWLWCVATLAVAEAVDLVPRRDHRSGAWVRRLVLVACGAAIAGGAALPAHAAPPDPSPSDRSTLDALRGLPLPDRQPGSGQAASGQAGRASQHPGLPTSRSASRPASRPDSRPASRQPSDLRAAGDVVVVRAGDSLWSLARERVPDRDPATVDALWRRIHADNLAVIGPDPDLILPGQRLVLPEVPR